MVKVSGSQPTSCGLSPTKGHDYYSKYDTSQEVNSSDLSKVQELVSQSSLYNNRSPLKGFYVQV